MIRQISTLLLMVYSLSIYGQNVKGEKHLPAPPPKPNDENNCCAKKYNLSVTKRLDHYPFNKAQTILIVSFNKSNALGAKQDIPQLHDEGKLPMQNDTLNSAELAEKIALNKNQIDSLTNILYNYDYKKKPRYMSVSNCFDPHHAIVFLDDKDKVFEYVEICFLCNNLRSSSDKVDVGNFCIGKYKLLKKYFQQLGLKVELNSND